MKKFLKGCIAFSVIGAAAISCNTTPSATPSEVAVGFIKAMNVYNFDSARQYVASNSLAVFSQTEESTKGVAVPDSIKQMLAQVAVKPTSETKVNDSTTNVDISASLPKTIMGMQEMKETLVLKKEKGAWKVDLLATQQKAMENMGMPMGGQQGNSNDTVPPTPPDTGAAPAPATK